MNRITTLLFLMASCAFANARVQGDCMQGGHRVTVTGGLNSQSFAMQSFVNTTGGTPTSGCTVSVYITGSGGMLATLTANTQNTTANPFVADATGHWYFEAVNGTYDITLSGAGISSPFTIGAVSNFDEAAIWIDASSSPYQGMTAANAITAAAATAGAGGVVFVPSSMASGDPTSLPSGVIVLDWRAGNLRIFGGNDAGNGIKEISSYRANISGDNPLGRFQIYSELGSVRGANGLPEGNDMVVLAAGSADLRLKTIPTTATSSTSVSAGTHTITYSTPMTQGVGASTFYSLASMDIDPGTSQEEVIPFTSFVSLTPTTLTAPFAKSHTAPYTILQEGAYFLDGYQIITPGDGGLHSHINVDDFQISPYLYLPYWLGATWPDSGLQFLGQVTGANGSNSDFIYRNSKSSSCFKFRNAAATADMLDICESGGNPILFGGNTTNQSLRMTFDSDAPRFTGQGTVGGLIFNAGAFTGNTGTFYFRDNLVDNNNIFTINTASGVSTANKLAIGTDAAFSNDPRGSWTTFFPGNLTSSWTGGYWTPDKAITITRVSLAAKTAPMTCSQNASIQIAQGGTTNNVAVSAATVDTGAIDTNYLGGTPITVSIVTPATCSVAPADVNFVVEYRMQ